MLPNYQGMEWCIPQHKAHPQFIIYNHRTKRHQSANERRCYHQRRGKTEVT